MITDQAVNFVYFSELLPLQHPYFFKQIEEAMKSRKIRYGLLPGTKDIWCRDYMPIQVSKDRFVQFKYDPRYLKSKKYKRTKTDPVKACEAIKIKPIMSNIKIDGGNVVRSRTKVIMTERIFAENPGFTKNKIIEELKRLFKVMKIITIPECPFDLFGHADGIVRFVEAPHIKDEDIVYVSDYSSLYPSYFSNLLNSLLREGLVPIILPYNPSYGKDDIDATGLYINYMQIGKVVIYPSFGTKEDGLAKQKFFNCFGSCAIPIQSNEIAKEGGVLNCISWNVMK